mmetsp:Transcript_25343/g.67334  ORF Transcript_25343/g.67334 Transcript_25343/m.67334 type:complete len:92 (+) Transcript_25343:1389-1664(+)
MCVCVCVCACTPRVGARRFFAIVQFLPRVRFAVHVVGLVLTHTETWPTVGLAAFVLANAALAVYGSRELVTSTTHASCDLLLRLLGASRLQ